MGKDVKKDLTTRDLGRALGRKIARLERHVRELEVASQAAFRSVEEGAIDWYDENGVLRERVGKQADGSYGRKTFTGDIPPAPTEPDVVVISDGVVAITWDGRWEEAYSHVGWRNVQIHLGDTATFTPDRDTQVGAIFAPRGGTIVAVTESDDDNPVWVRLVGMNDAGQTGDPSVAVLVDELDEDDLEDEPEELEWEDGDGHTLTPEDIAAGTVTFGLSHIPEQESLLAWWHPGGLAFAGVPQTRGESFTVDGEAATVTWSLAGFERVGDRLRVYYAFYAAPPAPVQYVGATSAVGSITSIALPAGVQAGDTLILGSAAWASTTCTDPRMTLDQTLPGQSTTLGHTWIGTADASGDPIAVTVDAAATAAGTVLVAVRGAVVATQVLSDAAPIDTATPTAPQVTDARLAVAIALERTGSFSTGDISQTGGYTVVAYAPDDKVFADAAVWESGTAATSPADTYTFTGTIDGLAIVVYKIGAGT